MALANHLQKGLRQCNATTHRASVNPAGRGAPCQQQVFAPVQQQRAPVTCSATAATHVKLPQSHLETSKQALAQLKESQINRECR